MHQFLLKRPSFWGAASLLITSVVSAPLYAADLQETFQLAQQFDPTIQAAEFDYQSAIERLPIARSAFRPQVNLSLNANLNDQDDDDFASFNELQLTLSLSQSLYNRQNSAIVNQSRLSVRQAEAQLLAEKQNLILRTANTYFDVLRAQIELEFSRSELDAIERQKEQAERRFEVGLVPVTDVRTAQAQFDLAIAAEIAAQNNLQTAIDALEVLTGTVPTTLSTLAADLPLVAPDPANSDAWVTLAKNQNLDLVAARLAAQAADVGVTSASGARFPTLDLVGVAQTTESERPNQDLTAGQLSLEINLPIYSGGLVSAQVRQARADAASARQTLAAQERSTVQQTRDAFRGVNTSIARTNALQQALISTRKSAEATDAGFRAGTRTSVEVLSSLRDVFAAESDFAGARYDYLINFLSLKAAAGTLTENDLIPINNFLVKQ